MCLNIYQNSATCQQNNKKTLDLRVNSTNSKNKDSKKSNRVQHELRIDKKNSSEELAKKPFPVYFGCIMQNTTNSIYQNSSPCQVKDSNLFDLSNIVGIKEVQETSTMSRLKPELIENNPFDTSEFSAEDIKSLEERELKYEAEARFRAIDREIKHQNHLDKIPISLNSITDNESELINSLYKYDENGYTKDKDRVIGSRFVSKKYFQKEKDRDLKSNTKRVYANTCLSRLKKIGLIKVIGGKYKRIYKDNGSGHYNGIRHWTRPTDGATWDESTTYDLIQASKVVKITPEVEIAIVNSKNRRLSFAAYIIKKRYNYLVGKLGEAQNKIVNLVTGLGITGSINKIINYPVNVVIKALSSITNTSLLITNPVNYLESICNKIIRKKHDKPAL